MQNSLDRESTPTLKGTLPLRRDRLSRGGHPQAASGGPQLPFEIGFRLISNKTIVFCKELNFYDEINEHLTMPDELEEFAGRVMEKLEERKLVAIRL